MRVGCAAYSYRDYLKPGKMTLEDFLDKAVEMKLDGVELTSYYFPSTEDAYLYDVKRKAYRRGLDISGTAVGNIFCVPKEDERAEQIALVKTWVDCAVKLGAPCVRVFAGRVPEGSTEQDAFGWTVEALKECVAYAAPKGILIAMENHGGLTATSDGTLALFRAVDSDWLGINLDLGNYAGDSYAEIEKTAPYAITCHAKTEVPGPEGKVEADLARMVDILDKAGYKGYLSIEYEAEEDAMTAVPKFAAQLRSLVDRKR